MALALDSSDLALRLAAENVPVAAIARALRIASSDLREQLLDAQLTGQLLTMPCSDWPVGVPREQRASQLAARLGVDPKDAVDLALMRLFELTPSEARLLQLLLQSSSLDRNRADMKAIDVHISNLRKRLAAFGVHICTEWGAGYRIDANHRRKAMKLLSRHTAATPVD